MTDSIPSLLVKGLSHRRLQSAILGFVSVAPSSVRVYGNFQPLHLKPRKAARTNLLRQRCNFCACLPSRGEDDSTTRSVAYDAESSLQHQQDPVTARVRSELAADGVDLDNLLNAGKVVNLTRKLDILAAEIAQAPAGSAQLDALLRKADKLRVQLATEKRLEMQTWLKQLFVTQALLFIVIGGCLANDVVPGVQDLPLVAKALGFWMTWLFTIPSLRARKGISRQEKSALNVAFLGTPLANLMLPFATKNCGLIWVSNIFILLGTYIWYGAFIPADGQVPGEGKSKEQARIKGLLKYLDWGSWR